jgi:hypothetical protein
MAKLPVSKHTQDAPTAPRVRDAFGFELDADGLPLSGPERARRLAEQAAHTSRVMS